MSVVESRGSRSRDDFIRELERSLVDLYSAGLDLESVEPDDEVPPDGMTHDEAAALQRGLGRLFGDYDYYRLVFDPYDPETEPVGGSLADDVADIHRDLAGGFAALRAGSRPNAQWQWKFGFDSHWGRHAAHAVYALYVLRVERLG